MTRKQIIFVNGDEAETVWAEPAAGNRYKIDSIPFGIYDVSLGDVIDVKDEHGALTFSASHQKSGNRTVRAYVATGMDSERGRALLALLARWKLRHETSDEHAAINLPPEANLEEFMVQLEMLDEVTNERTDPSGRC